VSAVASAIAGRRGAARTPASAGSVASPRPRKARRSMSAVRAGRRPRSALRLGVRPHTVAEAALARDLLALGGEVLRLAARLELQLALGRHAGRELAAALDLGVELL